MPHRHRKKWTPPSHLDPSMEPPLLRRFCGISQRFSHWFWPYLFQFIDKLRSLKSEREKEFLLIRLPTLLTQEKWNIEMLAFRLENTITKRWKIINSLIFQCFFIYFLITNQKLELVWGIQKWCFGGFGVFNCFSMNAVLSSTSKFDILVLSKVFFWDFGKLVFWIFSLSFLFC